MIGAIVTFAYFGLHLIKLLITAIAHRSTLRDTATGRWALVDTVIIEKADLVIRGASTYEDRYVRTPEGWRIQHTGYKRLFEEMGPRTPGTKTTAAYVGTDGRSSLV